MAGETLRIISGPGAGNRIPLQGALIVGRSERGLGNLAGDSEISRRHARFLRTDGGQLIVEELGSTNGTLVNGQRLTGAHVLSPGDRVTLGQTVLQLDWPPPPGAPVSDSVPAQAAPPGYAVAGPHARGGANEPTPGLAGEPIGGPPGRVPNTTRRRIVAGLVLGGLIVAAIVVAASGGDEGSAQKKVGAASITSDCGKNLGKDGPIAAVAYVQSNVAAPGRNGLILIPYRAGDMKPLTMSLCSSGGSGSRDPTGSGMLDANDQVVVNPEHTLLFSVNQGSDTIAVYAIQLNGGLQAVPGSPFSSNGRAPSTLALSGNTLVVANAARDGVRDLKKEAPNYTTFKVGERGKLTAVPGSTVDAKPGSSPTGASVPVRGGVAFATEESGPIRGFSISKQGVLTQAPGAPYDPPAQAFAPGFDESKKFALGVATHPKRDLVYMGLPTVPALAVFSFDPTNGQLAFFSSTPIQCRCSPSWLQITQDGHRLYASNGNTNSITAFDISNATKPKQIQTLAYKTLGNARNIQLSPDEKFLFGITPSDTAHVMSVGSDGKLTELKAASPVKLPVPRGANPQGIAVTSPGP